MTEQEYRQSPALMQELEMVLKSSSFKLARDIIFQNLREAEQSLQSHIGISSLDMDRAAQRRFAIDGMFMYLEVLCTPDVPQTPVDQESDFQQSEAARLLREYESNQKK